MPYVPFNPTSYRGDIWQDAKKTITEDYNWILDQLDDRGIIFIIAFIVLGTMTLLKVLVYIIEELQKPKMTYKHLDLDRHIPAECVTNILTRREAIEEVKNHDNLCPNDKVKNIRANALMSLRGYLYEHNLTLHGMIVKKINHRIPDEELLQMCRTGEISKPLYTTDVTFGDDINNLLKEVLGNVIDLRKNRFSQSTYIRIKNNDFFPLKDTLFNLYNEQVKLEFDEDKND